RNFKLTTDNLYNIFTLLKDLNPHSLNEKYDLIGTIYELHIKSGSNNGRDLGQFFTNRLVIEYMIDLVEPKIDETICDPTMGTGGFLTMTVKYLNNKYNINWSCYKNLIFGYDIDSDVKDLASLNLLLETGEKFETLYQQDVLSRGLKHKYKIILANEPMGVKTTYNLCCEKIKELGIKGNKSEVLFIQLFTQCLEQNGKCCVIIPDGFLFNDNNFYVNTRKYLVENFDIKKIVYLDDNFFFNTKVKTSILYFINNGNKTEKIEYYKLTFSNETKLGIKDYNDIITSNYNLLFKSTILPIYKNNQYKLGEIFDIKIGATPKRDIKEYWNGNNLWVTVSELNNNIIFDTKEKITDLGVKNSSVKIVNPGEVLMSFKLSIGKKAIAGVPLYTNEAIVAFNSKFVNIVENKYLYYIIDTLDLEKYARGIIGKGCLNKNILNDIKILVPDILTQKSIIKKLDLMSQINDKIYNVINLYQKQIKYLTSMLTFSNVKLKLSKLCNLTRGCSYKNHLSEKGYRLIKISNIKNGKIVFLDKDEYVDKIDDKSVLNKGDFIVSLVGSVGKIGLYEKDEKVTFDGRIAKFVEFDEQVVPKYLYYILKYKEELIKSKAGRTCQPNITPKCVLSLNIPIISKDKQDLLILYCDKISTIIDKLNNQVKVSDKQKIKFINDLYDNY
ncbi:MAG: N-6 DNA methylase, partial [Candidatus Micrarchaeaceae archaeon]